MVWYFAIENQNKKFDNFRAKESMMKERVR